MEHRSLEEQIGDGEIKMVFKCALFDGVGFDVVDVVLGGVSGRVLGVKGWHNETRVSELYSNHGKCDCAA